MKFDTAVIIIKASCYVAIGAGASLATSLAQWANSGEWPPRIQWIVIIAGASVSAATQLLSFFSGSFTTYRQQKKADDSQEPVTTVIEPTKPKVEPEPEKEKV